MHFERVVKFCECMKKLNPSVNGVMGEAKQFLGTFEKVTHPDTGTVCLAKKFDPQENDLCSILRISPLAKFVPTYQGIFFKGQQQVMLWEDFSKYSNYAELKLGDHEYGLFEEPVQNQAKGTSLTNSVRLIQAQIYQGRGSPKRWTSDKVESTPDLRSFLKTFLEGRESEMQTRLSQLIDQYEKMGPAFRMYNGSLFIAYNNNSHDIVVYLLNHDHTYIDIETNGCRIDDESTDDGVIDGLIFLYEALEASRCCLLV